MATTNKLELTFLSNTGTTITMNFPYADPNVSDNDVKALMNVIVSNGDVFEKQPVSIKSARVVTTTEQTLNVTD